MNRRKSDDEAIDYHLYSERCHVHCCGNGATGAHFRSHMLSGVPAAGRLLLLPVVSCHIFQRITQGRMATAEGAMSVLKVVYVGPDYR